MHVFRGGRNLTLPRISADERGSGPEGERSLLQGIGVPSSDAKLNPRPPAFVPDRCHIHLVVRPFSPHLLSSSKGVIFFLSTFVLNHSTNKLEKLPAISGDALSAAYHRWSSSMALVHDCVAQARNKGSTRLTINKEKRGKYVRCTTERIHPARWRPNLHLPETQLPGPAICFSYRERPDQDLFRKMLIGSRRNSFPF